MGDQWETKGKSRKPQVPTKMACLCFLIAKAKTENIAILMDQSLQCGGKSRKQDMPGPESWDPSWGPSVRVLCYLVNPTFRNIFIHIFIMKPIEPVVQICILSYFTRKWYNRENGKGHVVACLSVNVCFKANIYETAMWLEKDVNN